MTKRPDQHNLDQNESQATDYKFRRQTVDQNRRGAETETVEGGRGNTQTPSETMDARRRQSEQDRERELERAAGVKERGEGNHPSSGDDYEPTGDRSELRDTGASTGEGTDEALGESGRRSHQQSSRATGGDASSTGERAAGESPQIDRSERQERDKRDREELGRQDVSSQSRGAAEDVEERRQREARENEQR